MKKILFATIIAATTMTSLSAHAEGAYAGLAVNRSSAEIEVVGATSSSRDKPTGFKIYGGWEFTPNLAVEAGYADFGSAKTNFSTAAGVGSVEADLSSFYLAGRGTVPINDKFSAFGKLGLARNKSSMSGSGMGAQFSGSTNKTGLYAGVGLAYQINKSAAVTLEYESFGKFDNNGGKGNTLSLGARFSF